MAELLNQLLLILANPALPPATLLGALGIFGWQNKTGAVAGAKAAATWIRSKLPGMPEVGGLKVSGASVLLLALSVSSFAYQREWKWPDIPIPVPEVVDGKRHIVVLSESRNQSVAVKEVLIDLRDGPDAQYFDSKGHILHILEPDAKDENGKTPAIVETLNAQGVAPPALFILDGAKVLFKGPLPASAQAVTEEVRRTGG